MTRSLPVAGEVFFLTFPFIERDYRKVAQELVLRDAERDLWELSQLIAARELLRQVIQKDETHLSRRILPVWGEMGKR